MSEPRTKAGRALLDRYTGGSYNDWFGKAILAIEAEAIAQERERLRVAVEGLHTEAAVGIGGLHYRVKVVAKADVLALLSPDTGATTGEEE